MTIFHYKPSVRDQQTMPAICPSERQEITASHTTTFPTTIYLYTYYLLSHFMNTIIHPVISVRDNTTQDSRIG